MSLLLDAMISGGDMLGEHSLSLLELKLYEVAPGLKIYFGIFYGDAGRPVIHGR